MFSRDRKWMQFLANEAKELEPVAGARIIAALVDVNTPIAMGSNEKKTSPWAAYYRKNKDSIYFHAETRALRKAIKHVDEKTIRKSTLYVCRVKILNVKGKPWSWGLAKPCTGCMEALTDFPTKRIVYSLDSTEEEFEIMKGN